MSDDDIRDRWALAIAERDAAEFERDRLRAVVEGIELPAHAQESLRALKRAAESAEAERDRLRAKADEADVELTEFVDLITPLLHGTANALKGEPAPLHMHDWFDLPKVAADVAAERDRLRAVVAHLRESAESAIGQDRDDEYDEGNRDAWVYVRNVLDGKAST